jgi:ribosomal 30S subunit maturation factor RimM
MFSADVAKYAEVKVKENTEEKEKRQADEKVKAKTTQSQVEKEEATQSQEETQQEVQNRCAGVDHSVLYRALAVMDNAVPALSAASTVRDR